MLDQLVFVQHTRQCDSSSGGVTHLLMKRIDRQTELQSPDYQSLPHRWNPALRIEQTSRLASCLAEVRDWMTCRGHDRPGHHLQDDSAELYQLVAGDWNNQALATLSDFGDPPTEAGLITAARLVAHAPGAVLFAHVTLIAELLHRAEKLGQDTAELVLQALLTTTGAFAMWFEDQAKNAEQDLEQARRIVMGLPRGSAERRFYEQLAHRIEERLCWAIDRPRPSDGGSGDAPDLGPHLRADHPMASRR